MIHPSSELISHRLCGLWWATGRALVSAVYNRSLGTCSHCRSGGTTCMRIPVGPKAPAKFLFLFPNAFASSTWLHYRLFPHQWWGVASGSSELAQVHVPQQAKRGEGEPSGRKQKLWKLVVAQLLLFIELGWQ